MPRNLDHRIEIVAPVEAPARRRIVERDLRRGAADTTYAWELSGDGHVARGRRRPRAGAHLGAQAA